jgi:hypothetical protein
MSAEAFTTMEQTLMMQAITDTMNSEILDSVTRYYERKGYRLKSWLLIGADRCEVVYEKVGESSI